MVAVRESETRDPGWSVEEALKYVISAGVIGPYGDKVKCLVKRPWTMEEQRMHAVTKKCALTQDAL